MSFNNLAKNIHKIVTHRKNKNKGLKHNKIHV